MKYFAKPIIILTLVVLTSIPAVSAESFTKTVAPDGMTVWIYDGKIKNDNDFVEYYIRYCDKTSGNLIAKVKYDKLTKKIGIVAKSTNNTKLSEIDNMAKYLEKNMVFENIDENSMLINTNKKVLEILNIKPEEFTEIVKKEPENIQEWVEDFQKQIQKNWKPNKENDGNLKTIVEFYVTKDGKIESYKIKQTSGNAEFDSNATNALISSQPYDKLPEKYTDKILISFTFKFNDYNAMNNNSEYKDWWTDFQNQVQANWNPTKTSKTENKYKTTLSFLIAKNGKIEDCKIANPSGNSDFDNYAIQTLIAGQPYKQMPKAESEKIPIKFTFTFNPNNAPETHTYFNDEILNKIQKKWKIPVKYKLNQEHKEVVMKITVSQYGKIQNCTIITSSGIKEIDDSAVQAVYKASPLPHVKEKYLDYGKDETTGTVTLSR